MRILQVAASFEPAWSEGGIVRAETDITRGLVELGHHVDVFTTTYAQDRRPAGRHWAPESKAWAHYFPVIGPGTFAYSPALGAMLRARVRDYDIVHVHGVWTYPCLAAAGAARKAGVPYVVTTHGALDPWAMAHHPWRKRAHLMLVGRRVLVGAAFVHCTTPKEREKLEPLGLEARTEVVALPLPGDAAGDPPPAGEGRRAAGIAPETPWLLYLSRVHPMKGVDLLIRGLSLCRGPGARAVLSIVGPEETDYASRLRSLVREMGLESRVRFHGPLWGRSRLAWMRDATLFCITSHRENFGLVVAEAAASGAPVLVSDQVDLAPWVQKNHLGFVVSRDPPSIGAAIDHALSDPSALADMSRRAGDAARREFDRSRLSRTLEQLYATASRAPTRNGTAAWTPFHAERDTAPVRLMRRPSAELARAERDAPSLAAFARANHVEPIVAHALADALGWDSVGAVWRDAHDEWSARIGRYMALVDRVAAALARAGIRLVALKNVGIARGIHPCAACCPMGDIDVLVDPAEFPSAHGILEALGFRLQSRNPTEKMDFEYARRSGGAEYRLDEPGSETVWFELQWRPVAGRWLAPGQEPPASEFVARSVPMPGTDARLLSPEDNLLQVALHTAKHSYVRAPGFRLHFDVHRVISNVRIDWHRFAGAVARLNVRTPVFFSLAIPHLLFDTPVPPEVLRDLRPSALQGQAIARMLEQAGLFNPDERKFSRSRFMLFHALMYDSPRLLLRTLFPPVPWLKQRYGFDGDWLAPLHYVRRFWDLAFRRVGT